MSYGNGDLEYFYICFFYAIAMIAIIAAFIIGIIVTSIFAYCSMIGFIGGLSNNKLFRMRNVIAYNIIFTAALFIYYNYIYNFAHYYWNIFFVIDCLVLFSLAVGTILGKCFKLLRLLVLQVRRLRIVST